MKILSSTQKDYYDYVQGLYGGGDPKVVYVRNYVIEPEERPGAYGKVVYDGRYEVPKEHLLYLPGEYRYTSDERVYIEHIGIFVAGRYWIFQRTYGYDSIGQTKPLSEWKLKGKQTSSKRWQERESVKYEPGEESPRGIEIARKLRVPVFAVANVGLRSQAVLGRVPNLAEYGFPAIVPAEQMYQAIATFVANTINESPDLMPPTQQSDVQKVEAHGFDKRISFRHRK